jgi:hypothetical protein
MRHLAVTCTLLTCLLGITAAQMTHEETVVRTAYAKLAYATELSVLVNNVSRPNNALSNPGEMQKQMGAQLAFEFQSFKVGNLTDVADTRWDAMVTKPQQDLIFVVPSSMPYHIKLSKSESSTQMNYAMAGWQRSMGFDADWSIPMKEVIRELPLDTLKPEVVYSRYAAYTVTVKLDGQQRTYQAIFLFGKNPDGTEAIYPIDHVLGMGSLNYFMQNPIYPQPLLETHLREWPGIREWIASAGVLSDSLVQDVVCDAASGTCGIPAKVLEKALQAPFDPESRQFQPLTGPQPQANSADPTPAQATCASSNATFPSTPSAIGTADHKTGGAHTASIQATGTCTYTNGNNANCNSQCNVNSTAIPSGVDSGGTVTGYCHVVGANWANGTGSATNGGASCSGSLYGGATECSTSLCDCTVSVSALGVVSGSPQVIWQGNEQDPLNCNTIPNPQYLNSIAVTPAAASATVGATQQFTALGTYADGSTKTLTNALWTSSSPGVATIGGGSGLATGIAVGTTTITASSSGRSGAATLSVTSGGEGGGGSSGSGGGSCNGGGCGGSGGGNSCGSPIIIDAYGEGFHMTDVADGVLFDIRGDGHPVDMGWTARGYHNAFLALDRNGNGKIDNGEELFGNYTPQPKSKDANGYAALAEFDKPENGGNADGVINEKDAIYSKLLLWIDENHDGISQPNELHHLWELGVFSLSLKYVDTPHRDGFGNWFRYKGKINPLGEPGPDPVDRTSYDVFFELQAPGPRPPACE